MADTPIKDGIPSAPAQGTDRVPISRSTSGLKTTLEVQDLTDYAINPTEGSMPYRGPDQLLDAPADFVGGQIILSVSAIYPRAYRTEDATYTILITDEYIEATANTFDITLPDGSTVPIGQPFNVDNSGAGVITLKGHIPGETINNSVDITIASGNNVDVMWNGSVWRIK